MQLSHRVALDGVQLDSVDSRIIINRVETGDGKTNIATAPLAGDGMRVTGIRRDSIDITVRFCIRLKKRQMQDRETVLEKVNAWAAAGGTLTTNFKTNRKIVVFLAQPAAAGDPWDWTREYAMVFRACGVPYWQEETPTTKTKSITTSGNQSITVGGNARTVFEADFVNTSGSTIDHIVFSTGTGGYGMTFDSLGLGAGETLHIGHADTGKRCTLKLEIEGAGGARRSVLDKRSGHDELYVDPGSRKLYITSGGAGTMTVKCCGRFA